MKRPLLVILEGTNLTGKTTIGQKVAAKLNILYYEGVVKPHNIKEIRSRSFEVSKAMLTQFYSLFDVCKFSMVKDRLLITDYAYGKYFKRNIDEKFLLSLDYQFSKLNVKFLIFRADENVLKSRYEKSRISINDVLAIQKYYDKYLKLTSIPYLIIDTTNDVSNFEINKIVSWLEK